MVCSAHAKEGAVRLRTRRRPSTSGGAKERGKGGGSSTSVAGSVAGRSGTAGGKRQVSAAPSAGIEDPSNGSRGTASETAKRARHVMPPAPAMVSPPPPLLAVADVQNPVSEIAAPAVDALSPVPTTAAELAPSDSDGSASEIDVCGPGRRNGDGDGSDDDLFGPRRQFHQGGGTDAPLAQEKHVVSI